MEGISKSFPGVLALEHVDFDLEKGEIHALIGKNGAGKSTLIKLLGGVYQPDAGRIEVDGHEVHLHSPHAAMAHGIAIVHQELSCVPALNVAENIFLGRWPRRPRTKTVDWKALHDGAVAMLKRLESNIDPRQQVGGLRVAEQQLVEIGKALSRDPRVLIMDEPTSALSDQDAQRLLSILVGLAKTGVGVIYISHRLNEIAQIAQTITVLRDGHSVGTSAAGKMNRSGIVRLMLGEELAQLELRPPPPNEQKVVLSVRHLSRKGILQDVSFDLYEGEILGLAGLVGAGRSELVRAIFGRDRTDGGQIWVTGERIRRPSPARMRRLGLGFTPEDRKAQGLVLGLSVRDNTVLTVLNKLAPRGFIERKAESDMVETLIKDLRIKVSNQRAVVGTLSGGNQQKVVIAKWLALKPRVLILDEPTRGVDVQAKAHILSILKNLCAEGVGIIFISSELEEVLAVSHRVLTMARGRIVSESKGIDAQIAEVLLSATE